MSRLSQLQSQIVHVCSTLATFDKNAITFDQKELEKKQDISRLVGMKFCCASDAALINVKTARKTINFFPKIFSIKPPFF